MDEGGASGPSSVVGGGVTVLATQIKLITVIYY